MQISESFIKNIKLFLHSISIHKKLNIKLFDFKIREKFLHKKKVELTLF